MKKFNIVIIVLISAGIWFVSLYYGWLKEAAFFGYSIFKNWINSETSLDAETTTVKYGEFAYRLLNYVFIPESVTTIESNAFKGNKLISITIGSNVYLGKNAFGSNFEDVYYDMGMRSGTYTRDDYKSTEWIAWIENYGYKKNEDNITVAGYRGSGGDLIIPNEFNGRKITVIADKAFKEKKLNKVTIPASITYIGEDAFRENNLSSIIIPDKVYRIENYAFYKNQLNNINIGKTVGVIGKFSFAENKLTRIVIPNNVKNIEVNAFKDNQITRVSIGENVSLGSASNVNGILGDNTGFNSAYENNKNKAGTYTRPSVKSTTWTRSSQTSVAQAVVSQTERIINSVNWKSSDNRVPLGTQEWSVNVQQLNEPVKNCTRFTLEYGFTKVNKGDPYGTQEVYVKGAGGRWSKVGSISVPNNDKVITVIRLDSPADIYEIGVVPAKSASIQTDYENYIYIRDFAVVK